MELLREKTPLRGAGGLVFSVLLAAGGLVGCGTLESPTGICAFEALEPIEQFPDVVGTGSYGCRGVQSVEVVTKAQRLVDGSWQTRESSTVRSFSVVDEQQNNLRVEAFCEDGQWRTVVELTGLDIQGVPLSEGVDTVVSDSVRISC